MLLGKFFLCQIRALLSSEEACRLASEIKAKDGNQGILADEEPVWMWAQKQAIDFISK